MMVQGILTTKLSASFQSHLSRWIEAENQLSLEEQKFKKNPTAFIKNKLAFVPDHLAFGCEEGVEIFKITAPPLQSFVVVRSP